jgi:hypothetical protein
MEPRWLHVWKREGMIYLGGTNDFDLWFDESNDIRVVWGQSVFEWDWFYWSGTLGAYTWSSHDKEDVDHDRVLDESLTYIRLFAPWAEDKTKSGSRSYHE